MALGSWYWRAAQRLVGTILTIGCVCRMLWLFVVLWLVLGIAVILLGFSALRSLRRSTESVLGGLMLFILFL